MSELNFSNQEELRKLALANGLIMPSNKKKEDSEIPLIPDGDVNIPQEPEDEGMIVAEKIRQFTGAGYRPTYEEAIKYKNFMDKQEISAWAMIGQAIEQTASDLTNAALSLAGDVLSLKLPKVAGSVVEGAALGTKNWYYMMEEAKYNEASPLHKLLYKKTASDEEYYYNLTKLLDVREKMERDINEGILLPKEIEVGGVKLDLWNPATVMGISYVADPSWVMPNLGIESTIAKGMRGASKIMALNDQLANVAVWSSKQAELAAGKVQKGSSALANQIVKTEEALIKNLEDITGQKVFVGTSGNIVDKNDLGRGAMSAAGLNAVKIPAWGFTTLAWGASKITETAASAAQLAAKIAQEPTTQYGLRMSERLAMQSDNASVRALAGTWAKTGSPLVEWVGNTARTSLHSAMYGGAFGFTFGGEEGFYHGIGSGFTIGSAFHQIGAVHGTVAGVDAPREVIKNFLWATEGYDFANKEGVFRLLANSERDYGADAKLQLMSDIAATERLQRDVKKVILTEERIKEIIGENSPEWAEFIKEANGSPDFGGIAFQRTLDGQKVVVINADRAHHFAAKEELFHTMLMDTRYGLEFQRHAIDALIGSEDNKGALYRVSKEDGARMLETFRDAYLGVEDKASNGDPERINKTRAVWNEVINKFRNGETDGRLNKLFEEFLASYWVSYIGDKPIDFLLKGGDLGLVRNAIELAKDAYKNTMQQDLRAAGGKFVFGREIDGFFTNHNTGERVRIPKLEKLMKHFVERSRKEMYTGWVQNKRSITSVEKALTGGLDHLVVTNADGSARIGGADEVSKKVGKGLRSAIEEIAQLEEGKGLKFQAIGKNGEVNASFSSAKPKKKKPKKKKVAKPSKEVLLDDEGDTTPLDYTASRRYNKHWDEAADLLAEQDKTPITNKELAAAEQVAGEAPDMGGWSTDRRKKFWKSVWNGNPRIKITGVATSKELAILEKWLPYNVVNRFKHLNAVIEMSRMGTFAGNVSNILRAEVVTDKKGPYNRVSLREEGPFTETRNFQPIELNIYFERIKTKGMEDGEEVYNYQSGEANMLAKIIDHDAILSRVDYFFDEYSGDIDYKEVRRLFQTKEDLYIAAKSLLSHYSTSKIAEGGIAIFKNAGSVSVRDAGRMRTIVNGVLGFHPTKTQMRGGQYANPWHELQIRKNSEAADLPAVIKDFRVDRIGHMHSRDGEGFFYDHDNAHVRSTYNFSPSKSHRDHEGNPMSKAEMLAVKNSVYRNREGEVLSVYSLRKALGNRRRNNRESVFDYVDESLGAVIDGINPRLRGRQYVSESGWMHYTPDMSEASFVSRGSMETGYIDTTKHLDISSVDHNSTPDQYIRAIAEGMSRLTGRKLDEHLKEIFNLRDIDGYKLSEKINGTKSPFEAKTDIIEGYIFTPDMAKYFKNNDIHSLEYIHFNPVRQHATSAVAVWDNGRFVENRARRREANYFAFSPSKKREVTPDGGLAPKSMLDQLDKRIAATRDANIARGMRPDEAVLEAFMEWKVSEDGESLIQNIKKITENDIDKIIAEETTKYEKLLGKELGDEFFDYEGRKKINTQLKPLVLKSLRKSMPFAPNAILNQIADIALNGITAKSITDKKLKLKFAGERGSGRTADYRVIRDSVLARYKKHYQMSADKINNGYKSSLFRAVEMSEGEFSLAKKVPAFMDAVRDGTQAEWIANNRDVIDTLFGDHGGLRGFEDMVQGREKEIFILMEKALQTEMEDTGGNKFKIMNYKALEELYAARTKEFVYETLKENKLDLQKRGELLKTYQKFRNMAQEKRDLRSRFRSYNDTIHAFIKEEFNTRVLDTLTALEIDTKLDAEVVDSVRAIMYNDVRNGLYKFGSYDAIAQSVRYYYAQSNLEGKNKVINARLAVQKNLLKSLADLEAAGFVGINFHKIERPHEIIDGQKNYLTHKVDIVDPQRGVIDTLEAFNVWNFDGSYFKVIEGLSDETRWDKSILKLIDTRNGREVLTQPVTREENAERTAVINNFLREASGRMNKEVPATVLNSQFGKVDGPMKSYILINHELNEYRGDVDKSSPLFTDWSNYDLYKNGNYFVAVRKWNTESADIKTLERINKLKDDISQGYEIVVRSKKGKNIKTKRVFSIEEIVQKREQMTELQGRVNKDRGIILEVDNIGTVTKIGSPHTLLEQSKALSALKKGKIENYALQHHVTELFADYVKLETTMRKRQAEKIAEVLGTGENGNIAKIKKLEKMLREAETEMQSAVNSKMREMNKQLKDAGIDREVTVLEAYRRIEMDLDGFRKNSDNAMKRLTALENVLFTEGAFPEYNGMSSEQKRLFEERIRDAGEEEWVKNPLSGKMEWIKSDWVSKNAAKLPNESRIEYATRLRKEYAKQRSLHAEYSTKFEQLSEIIDRKKSTLMDVEEQLEFLVRQYGLAKGLKISKKTALALIEKSKKGEELVGLSTINVSRLKNFTGKKSEPVYLPDSEGIIPDKKGRTGIPEKGETVEDLRKIFANVLANVSGNWHSMSDSVMVINTLIERQGVLKERGKFKEKAPVKEDFESPRQFEQAYEDWNSRKNAYESNYLQILGTIESWGKDKKTGLDKKSFSQRPNKQVNERIRKLMQDELGEMNAMLGKAMRLAREAKNNAEFNFNAEFEAFLTSSTKLTGRQEGWVRDPLNRERVNELQDAFARGDLSENQLVEKIQNEAFLTSYGEEGVELMKTDEELQLTRTRIAEKMDRIDSILFGKYREKYDPNFVYNEEAANATIEKINKDIDDLRQTEGALLMRLDDIIAGVERANSNNRYQLAEARNKHNNERIANKRFLIEQWKEAVDADGSAENRKGLLNVQKELESLLKIKETLEAEMRKTEGDKDVVVLDDKKSLYNSSEFRELVDRVIAARKTDEQKEVLRVQRVKERIELAKLWEVDYKKFLDMFREDALEIGLKDPNIVVSANNPRTRHLFNAFPKITYDLYGSVHPLDWSGSGYEIGYTERGEQIVRFRGGQDPAGLVNQNQTESARRMFTVADYMFYARKRADYHMANPDAPMSAEDYLLIKSLVPKSRYVPSDQKVATINKLELANKRRVASGILDNVSVPENRQKLLRSFIKDGLSLVMDSRGERLRALQRISGLDNDAWNKKLLTMSEEEILKAASTREVIENAFYWIADGYIPLSDATKKTTMLERKDGTKTAIRTEIMDVQRLIEFEEFSTFMDEELSAAKLTSMFDNMPYAKAQYEMLAPEDRMGMNMDIFQRLAMDNNAEMLRYQREQHLARGEKPVWFADRFHEAKHTGKSTDYQMLEQERIGRLIAQTAAVESSIQKYKGDITGFMKHRPMAVRNMLGLKDGLHFPDLVFRETDGFVTQADSWKESADGRYIIQRVATEKKGVHYKLYFIGETVKNADGATMYEIPTTQLGNFGELDQAQIMARFYEDDIQRIKQTTSYVAGGEGAFDSLRVGDVLLAREGAGAVLKTAYDAPAFSKAVIAAYKKAKGKPENVADMETVLRPLYNFGETQRLVWSTANGKPMQREFVITPRSEGILSKYYDRDVASDGVVKWTQKPRKANDGAQSDPTVSVDSNAPSEQQNPSTNTKPDANTEPTPEDKVVSNATEFTIVQNKSKNGERFEQWEILKNRLGYQIIRLKDKTSNRDVFKLFNATSNYLGQYYDEMDAVDEILQQEFKKLYGNE